MSSSRSTAAALDAPTARARSGQEHLAAVRAVATAGAAALAVTALLVSSSDALALPFVNAALRALNIASAVGVGVATWWLRPRSRLGPLLVAVGLLFALSTLQAFEQRGLYNAGRLVVPLATLALFYAFLAFPTGRVTRPVERRVILAGAALVCACWTLDALLAHRLAVTGILSRCQGACPANPFRAVDASSATVDAVTVVAMASEAATAWAVVVALVLRMRGASRVQRLSLGAAVAPLGLLAAAFTTAAVLQGAGRHDAAVAVGWAYAPLFVSIPLTFLIGQVRGRLFAGAALRRMLSTLGPHPSTAAVELGMADALGDPTLRIAYRAPSGAGYLDAAGRAVPDPGGARPGVAPLAYGHEEVATVLHDGALDDIPGLMLGTGAAALLALRNAQLSAELQASVRDLRASRARVAWAADAARRQLERDLQHGAGRRLADVREALARAEGHAGAGERELLAELGADADAAIASLRETAHGIYPPLLAEHGVVTALAGELAAWPMHATIDAPAIARGGDEAEAAVFFACVEAVQNAGKHAGADARITVTVRENRGELRVTVADDGRGFDVTGVEAGSGLTNIRDRLEAVGGHAAITSAPGRGTTVSLELPWPG